MAIHPTGEDELHAFFVNHTLQTTAMFPQGVAIKSCTCGQSHNYTLQTLVTTELKTGTKLALSEENSNSSFKDCHLRILIQHYLHQ